MTVDLDDDDGLDIDDDFTPNPSRFTTELTRFEWEHSEEDGEGPYWPTYSYRLGNWEWVVKPGDRTLLVYNLNNPDLYCKRKEQGFTGTDGIIITDVSMCASLNVLHSTHPAPEEPEDLNVFIAALLRNCSRGKNER